MLIGSEHNLQPCRMNTSLVGFTAQLMIMIARGLIAAMVVAKEIWLPTSCNKQVDVGICGSVVFVSLVLIAFCLKASKRWKNGWSGYLSSATSLVAVLFWKGIHNVYMWNASRSRYNSAVGCTSVDTVKYNAVVLCCLSQNSVLNLNAIES